MNNEVKPRVGLTLTLTLCTWKFPAFISPKNVLLPRTCTSNKVNIRVGNELSNS